MKQILQSLRTGETQIVEVPCPQVKPHSVLIQTHLSLISSGTEKMLIDFGKASWIEKIRQQPDKVRLIASKIKTEGLLSTFYAVRSKLDELIPMGYCNVGSVIAKGEHVTDFSIGDRVVSNGYHAEIVCVPKNLCSIIPDEVSNEEAVFSVLGAVALQGLRLAQPLLGEKFVVIGLGLIGMITIQLLRANGCSVLGIDLDQRKTKIAAEWGVETVNAKENVIAHAQAFSHQRGVDGVLITASTNSHQLIHQAATMCRRRGRIILVGIAGLNLSRSDFYQKELTFQVSCSYGPGRYDKQYEEEGNDYPLEYVRFTAQRHFETFLSLLKQRQLVIQPLISHRFSFKQAEAAYHLLQHHTSSLGILLNYTDVKPKSSSTIRLKLYTQEKNHITVGLIGAGHYAGRMLIPAFKKTNAKLKWIACQGGISGTQLGKKFKFEYVTTEPEKILEDNNTSVVVIATRHDQHAHFICRSLQTHKHVFVEKPLCLTLSELNKISEQYYQSKQLLMIGFNRRFSPHIQYIKKLLQSSVEPMTFIITINADDVPASHWIKNPILGGGRIIGEACHHIDLLRFLAGCPIESFQIAYLKKNKQRDCASITLTFSNGSMGTLHYFTNGNLSFPKEKLEIFSEGRILELNNFRMLKAFGWQHFKKMHLWRQDKGQNNCVAAFVEALQCAKPSPIPFEEILEVTRTTLAIAEQFHS